MMRAVYRIGVEVIYCRSALYRARRADNTNKLRTAGVRAVREDRSCEPLNLHDLLLHHVVCLNDNG
jgi:hypothetical protein